MLLQIDLRDAEKKKSKWHNIRMHAYKILYQKEINQNDA